MANTTGPETYKLLLFISGMSGKSVVAVENLRVICDRYLPENCDITIVDLNREPELATQHQIIAIPTLIKLSPAPVRTILGDLSDTAKVLKILEINE